MATGGFRTAWKNRPSFRRGFGAGTFARIDARMPSKSFALTTTAHNGTKNGNSHESCLELLPESSDPYFVDRTTLVKAAWGLLGALIIALMLCLVGVVVYVECFFKWSYPVRIDCNLDQNGVDYSRCIKRGCKYVVTDDHLPVCFFPEDYGYLRKDEPQEVLNGKTKINLVRSPSPSLFGNEFNHVTVTVSPETSTQLRIQIQPSGERRYRVPLANNAPSKSTTDDFNFKVSYSLPNEPFRITISRKENGKVLLDTHGPGTVLADQFLQVTTRLATGNVYGLGGARMRTTLRHNLNWKTTTFFTQERLEGGAGGYPGTHPFYMVVEEDGRAHGVFLRNSNPMEAVLQPEKLLTFRAIGGVLDFLFFLGESPNDVMQQFMQVVGRPALLPYWALRHHLALQGGAALERAQQVAENYSIPGLPMPVFHFERGYANAEDTVSDREMASRMQFLRKELKNLGVKLTLRADPVVSAGKSSIEDDRHDSTSGQLSSNKGDSLCFVDFSKSSGKDFWREKCKGLEEDIGFDGVVLGLNEPSYPHRHNGTDARCQKSQSNSPPYSIGKDKDLFGSSLCGDAEHFAGCHYDFHNLYGYNHSEATWRSLVELQKKSGERPLIISRATFSGSGKYAGHWFQEGDCSWESLRRAVVETVEYSLFGVPYSGGSCDTQTSSGDLRAAWVHTTALFPLFVTELKLEDNAANGYHGEILNETISAFRIRNKLLPHFYTVFHDAHTSGSAVLRPLFYEFSKDSAAHDVSYQFMWGSSVLVSPNIFDEPQFQAYFPKGLWYRFDTGEMIQSPEGKYVDLEAPQHQAHIHVRGGFIVPTLDEESSTNYGGHTHFSLFVAPDNEGNANGSMYWDDGITYATEASKLPHVRMQFTLTKGQDSFFLTMKAGTKGRLPKEMPLFSKVIICGMSSESRVSWNKRKAVSIYKEKNKVLQISLPEKDPPETDIQIIIKQ